MVYAPGTAETDPKKQNRSLQANAAATSTNTTNITQNTTDIANANTNIASNTSSIATLNASAATFVVGPGSATANGFAVYNGTTGKLVKDHAATIALGSEVSGTLPTANGGLGNAAGAWTTYTPTITATTGTFTTVSAAGSFYVIGKLVHFTVSITVTTVGTASGRINLPLPTGTAARNCVAHGEELATTLKTCSYEVQTGASTGLVTFYDGSFPGASGNVIVVTGIYEQA